MLSTQRGHPERARSDLPTRLTPAPWGHSNKHFLKRAYGADAAVLKARAHLGKAIHDRTALSAGGAESWIRIRQQTTVGQKEYQTHATITASPTTCDNIRQREPARNSKLDIHPEFPPDSWAILVDTGPSLNPQVLGSNPRERTIKSLVRDGIGGGNRAFVRVYRVSLPRN